MYMLFIIQEFQFIYHLNDGARIDPSSLVVMKLQQMKRIKVENGDEVGNQSTSTSVTLREKFISTPRMMHVPHPFKRRDTTAIEMFEGLEKVTSNSSRQEMKPNLDGKPSSSGVAPSVSTTTQVLLQENNSAVTPVAKAQAAAAGETMKVPKGEGEGQEQLQVNKYKDNKRLPVVAQSTVEDSMTIDTDDDYKS